MLSQELKYLKNNTKGKFFLICFRFASYFYQSKFRKVIGFPILFFYKFVVNYVLGIEVPANTKIGFGFNVFHGQGLVINKNTIVGNYVIVRQNTTIGNKEEDGLCPLIGNNVNIGANVCIIGNIVIGDHVTIGAGSVVTKNIPAYSVVVGNPARIIKITCLSN